MANCFSRSSFNSSREAATYNRVAWRLIPFLLVLYIISFLDRVNVGFAKLQMSADIGLSDAVFGLGAGIFFIGYAACEIPSNLLLQRFGLGFGSHEFWSCGELFRFASCSLPHRRSF
jgi:sugar phosphate permease